MQLLSADSLCSGSRFDGSRSDGSRSAGSSEDHLPSTQPDLQDIDSGEPRTSSYGRPFPWTALGSSDSFSRTVRPEPAARPATATHARSGLPKRVFRSRVFAASLDLIKTTHENIATKSDAVRGTTSPTVTGHRTGRLSLLPPATSHTCSNDSRRTGAGIITGRKPIRVSRDLRSTQDTRNVCRTSSPRLNPSASSATPLESIGARRASRLASPSEARGVLEVGHPGERSTSTSHLRRAKGRRLNRARPSSWRVPLPGTSGMQATGTPRKACPSAAAVAEVLAMDEAAATPLETALWVLGALSLALLL